MISILGGERIPPPAGRWQHPCGNVDEIFGPCDLPFGHTMAFGHMCRWPGFIAQWSGRPAERYEVLGPPGEVNLV